MLASGSLRGTHRVGSRIYPHARLLALQRGMKSREEQVDLVHDIGEDVHQVKATVA